MMPVREAVSRLIADKALEVAPNRTVRVPIMSAAQFRDLTKVRIEIEGYAAAQAALLRGSDDLAAIAQAEAAMRAESTTDTPDLPRAVELNKTFHFAVYAAAQSPTLVEIIRALWLKAGPVLNLDLRANPERLATGARLPGTPTCCAGSPNTAAKTPAPAIAADIEGAAAFILSRGGLSN